MVKEKRTVCCVQFEERGISGTITHRCVKTFGTDEDTHEGQHQCYCGKWFKNERVVRALLEGDEVMP